jgi:predicted nucleic acid-binding protein
LIFIDTGAFLARYLRRDEHHQQAVSVWEALRAANDNCVTSNFVLDEAFTLLGRWAGYGFAVQRAENIYASKALTIFRPDEQDEVNALKFFGKYADKRISFTDCISFVIMKREKIHRVFSFDRQFEFGGFDLVP